LSDPLVLKSQRPAHAGRFRANALVGQFLRPVVDVRDLRNVLPDPVTFPDFDDSLRGEFLTETELFIKSQLRENRGIPELAGANYTFLNEHLARHYGIPNVYGSRFRRVPLTGDEHRGGLFGQGSILTVTSYPTRTSPVLRGKWLLANILGTRRLLHLRPTSRLFRRSPQAASRRRARVIGGTPEERSVLGLPLANGSARLRAGEL